MKKIKKILAKSAWFCHFGWGRVFDGVGKGFTFLVDIFTPGVASYSLNTLSIPHSRLVPQKLSNATWLVICPIENTASQYFRKYELAASTIGQMTNSNTLY